METVLIEKDFVKVTVDFEKSLVKQIFFETQKDIQQEEFYELMKLYVDKILTLYQAQKIKANNIKTLVDVRKTNFVILPQWQERIDKELLTKLKGLGAKVAFIQSQDIFVEVSIEQLMNEESSRDINARYFEDEKEALEWLYSI